MDFTTLFFLVVAVIIFFRLRSVLGQRTGNEGASLEKKWPSLLKEAKTPEEWPEGISKPLPLAAKFEVSAESRLEGIETDTQANTSLKSIASADAKFNVQDFLKGAKIAYEIIVTAFAKGEREKLRPLLSTEIFNTFDHEIIEREKKGESVDFHFIGITRADITAAQLKQDKAQISMRFSSKLVQAIRNSKGDVIDGDATATTEVSDSWTFERLVSSPDPNWKLVAIEDA
jgi:predicted lipid-binding transport protein (Tim44 family)